MYIVRAKMPLCSIIARSVIRHKTFLVPSSHSTDISKSPYILLGICCIEILTFPVKA